MIRHPNCVGETGTYHVETRNDPASVMLSGVALPRHRTTASAIAAGHLDAGDQVGVNVRAAGSDEAWEVWVAALVEGEDGPMLVRETFESGGSTAIADLSAVEVVLTVTALSLTLAIQSEIGAGG